MKKKKYTPFEKGFFRTTDGCRLYYERYGNPRGLPVLFLHGGPGAGFRDSDKRFFDARKHHVLLFDQRGAGRSKPFASIKNNTTQKLVEDIVALLDHFGFGRVLVFGGSWCSTLALVFALSYPERVSRMILRGIFLADRKAINHYIKGGVQSFFPEEWARVIALVPEEQRKDPVQYFLSKMQNGNSRTKNRFAYEWARYEMSIMRLNMDCRQIDQTLRSYSYRSLAVLEAFYIKNRCFLPEGWILKHASRIAHLPVSIVHGRYDFICPPEQAYRLKERLPKAHLRLVCAGHAGGEVETEKALREELRRYKAQPARKRR